MEKLPENFIPSSEEVINLTHYHRIRDRQEDVDERYRDKINQIIDWINEQEKRKEEARKMIETNSMCYSTSPSCGNEKECEHHWVSWSSTINNKVNNGEYCSKCGKEKE